MGESCLNSIGGKKYYKELDVLKGVAILTVVLEHAFSVKYVDLTGYLWCGQTVDFIKSFNMQLFFMVSGFLFANSDTSNYGRAYRSKIDRLLVPMSFIFAVGLCLCVIFPSVINEDGNTSLLKKIEDFIIYGKGYWFIYSLFIIYCLLIPIKKKLSERIIALTCLLFVLNMEFSWLRSGVLQWNSVSYEIVFFLIGYLLYIHYENLKRFIASPYTVVLCIAVYALLWQFNNVDFVRHWFFPILMSLAVWGVCYNVKGNAMLEYFGRNSLQFYLFNGYALVAARIICCLLLKISNPFLLVALVFVLCLIVLFIMTEVARRIPVVSYLCGFGRKKKKQ